MTKLPLALESAPMARVGRRRIRDGLFVFRHGESFKAFVPAPLPPRPAIEWSPALRGRFDATQRSSVEALAVAGQEVRAVRAARRKG